ncbi:MAG: hypothetical protein K2Q28_03070 [Hyphomicrobium sp.]|nr:hypothetical protein [Hyphomicrobium sp.]
MKRRHQPTVGFNRRIEDELWVGPQTTQSNSCWNSAFLGLRWGQNFNIGGNRFENVHAVFPRTPNVGDAECNVWGSPIADTRSRSRRSRMNATVEDWRFHDILKLQEQNPHNRRS